MTGAGTPTTVSPMVLLDTHVWIWLVEGTPGTISERVLARLESAAGRSALRVSALSAWEVAILTRKRRLQLTRDPASWVSEAITRRGITEVRLNSAVAVAAALLPTPAPEDPADRFLLATAFSNGWTLATRDADIISYAAVAGISVLDARN